MDEFDLKNCLSGVTLVGRRQKNGSIKLGIDGHGSGLHDWPRYIDILGIELEFECVKNNGVLFPTAPQHAHNIEWATYL